MGRRKFRPQVGSWPDDGWRAGGATRTSCDTHLDLGKRAVNVSESGSEEERGRRPVLGAYRNVTSLRRITAKSEGSWDPTRSSRAGEEYS